MLMLLSTVFSRECTNGEHLTGYFLIKRNICLTVEIISWLISALAVSVSFKPLLCSKEHF